MSNEIGRMVASTLSLATERRTAASSLPSGTAPQGGGTPPSDKITLTRDAQSLQSAQTALANTPEVDTTRVQGIKLSLSQGTYQVDATRVAQRMVNFETSLAAAAPTAGSGPAPTDPAQTAPTNTVADPTVEAQVAGESDSRIQRTLSVDPESGTMTRTLSATRDDGTTFSREVTVTRDDEGFVRSSSIDNGRGVTREGSFAFDAETSSFNREVNYTSANGGELNVRAKGRFDEGGVSRVIQFEGGRGQPVS